VNETESKEQTLKKKHIKKISKKIWVQTVPSAEKVERFIAPQTKG
jgi:hypothetical protein